MKILILDDDAFELKLLTIQLRNFGLRGRGFADILVCERGQDALALLTSAHEEIGLIFCDLQMPEMDGVEFVRHLVELGYAGGIVLISGENERILQTAERLAAAHGLKVIGALHKPVQPEQLRLVLDQLRLGDDRSLPREEQLLDPEDLRRGIAAGELVNYYQPKVSLVDAAVVGVETLVRWRHPQLGMLPPDCFIALAEQHKLIDSLAHTVVIGALAQTQRWHAAGHALHVAINISMANLSSLAFPDLLAQEASAAGVSLNSLVLEVTESQLMKDPRAQLDILARLRLKQVGLSIDDFGTGYSSLAQLRDLPFDELKLDRGFVHGAWRTPSLQPLVQASLGLARQLGMTTVAEGIEDREDWDYLRASGCDLAQGYFIARPMPAEAFDGWLHDWRPRRRQLSA